jgi:sn-glycerol 3-phosphate transport system permease protein
VPSDDKQYEALEKLNLRNNLFQNGMGISVPTFSLWFIAAEWDGLRGFFNFVWQAMLSTPRSVQMVVEYFTEVPTYALYPSLVVGAIVGGISTAIYYLIARGHLKLPAPRGNPIWAGILGGIVLYGLGISLGLSLLLLVGIILLSAYGFSRETRQFIVQQTLPPVISPQTVRFLVVGGLIGLGLGAISSQILLYPMQHCPYRVNEAQRFYQDTQLRYGIGITAVSTFILLIPTWTLMQRQGGKKATSTSGYFRNPVLPYIFLAPTLLLLIVFLYYPASELIPLSFRLQPDPINQADSAPVCLENYVRITDSNYTVIDRLPSGREILNTDYPLYENSFTVTLTLTFAIVLFTMILALGIAVLASQKVRGAGIYRTLLVWPYAISPIVTGAVFLAMFRDNSAGVVNWTLETTTGESLKWLKDVDLAPWVIIYAAVWNALGFNILFYIAGLQNIPKDLLEAAAIDGANVFQRFGRITFPLLSPFTFFLLIANITYAFYGIYGAVDVLTDGGPPSEKGGATVGATDILIYKVYNDAFGGSAGSGAAQTVLLFMMVAAITLVQFIFVERRVTYAGD